MKSKIKSLSLPIMVALAGILLMFSADMNAADPDKVTVGMEKKGM